MRAGRRHCPQSLRSPALHREFKKRTGNDGIDLGYAQTSCLLSVTLRASSALTDYVVRDGGSETFSLDRIYHRPRRKLSRPGRGEFGLLEYPLAYADWLRSVSSPVLQPPIGPSASALWLKTVCPRFAQSAKHPCWRQARMAITAFPGRPRRGQLQPCLSRGARVPGQRSTLLIALRFTAKKERLLSTRRLVLDGDDGSHATFGV